MHESAVRAQPLYRKLPRGPSSMSREEVARDQRARIYGAMIESVRSRGYHRTAVADVIALAGVSRRAFYELFRDKHQCLTATHTAVVGQARREAVAAWSSEYGWSNRLHSACRRLFAAVTSQPDHAQFVLIHSPGATPGARERASITDLAFERPLRSVLSSHPEARALPQVSAMSIIGGVRYVMFRHVYEQRELDPSLSAEVIDWVECYRAPGRVATASRALPPRPPLSIRPLLESASHARAADALIGLTAAAGYHGFSDADVAHAAKMSTHAFHKLYEDKEACLIAVRRALIESTMAAARDASAQADSWPEGVRLSIAQLLHGLAANELAARVALVDFLDTGASAVTQAGHPVEALAALIEAGSPRPRVSPQLALHLVAGAIWAVLDAYARRGAVGRLPGAADLLAFTAMAPFLGTRPALEEIAAVR